MNRSILLGILILSLVGCKAAELEEARTETKRCEAELEETKEEHKIKVGLLEAQEARVCAELESVVHERSPVHFTAGKEQDVAVPCSDNIRVHVHKHDSRGWVYLGYEKADQGVLYSDRLHYTGTKSNRNALKFEETYVSVTVCDHQTCRLQCVYVPGKHPTTSCGH